MEILHRNFSREDAGLAREQLVRDHVKLNISSRATVLASIF